MPRGMSIESIKKGYNNLNKEYTELKKDSE